jgi:hypothetical protein
MNFEKNFNSMPEFVLMLTTSVIQTASCDALLQLQLQSRTPTCHVSPHAAAAVSSPYKL